MVKPYGGIRESNHYQSMSASNELEDGDGNDQDNVDDTEESPTESISGIDY